MPKRRMGRHVIADAIRHLSSQERAELRRWILEDETSEMLAAIDAGIRSAETEPKLSAEQLRGKLKSWTSSKARLVKGPKGTMLLEALAGSPPMTTASVRKALGG